MTDKKKEKTPSMEEMFLQIEEIIAQMEGSDTSLDASFLLYEKGIGKLKECGRLLDEVEKKMQVLNEAGKQEEL